jgi:hypothetical protein
MFKNPYGQHHVGCMDYDARGHQPIRPDINPHYQTIKNKKGVFIFYFVLFFTYVYGFLGLFNDWLGGLMPRAS